MYILIIIIKIYFIFTKILIQALIEIVKITNKTKRRIRFSFRKN